MCKLQVDSLAHAQLSSSYVEKLVDKCHFGRDATCGQSSPCWNRRISWNLSFQVSLSHSFGKEHMSSIEELHWLVCQDFPRICPVLTYLCNFFCYWPHRVHLMGHILAFHLWLFTGAQQKLAPGKGGLKPMYICVKWIKPPFHIVANMSHLLWRKQKVWQ